jgi:hypothetical protein
MSMDNPRTHAEREAAQRADEADLPYVCGHCYTGLSFDYASQFELDDALLCGVCRTIDQRTTLPPMAGGAPSHYDDPAWHADEAWHLQEERNAESAREAAEAEDDVCSCGHGRGVHIGYPLGCRTESCPCIVWDYNDPLPCACGHDEDDHRGGTGGCEHVVEQLGPLGLFCSCEAYQWPAVC